MKRTAILIGATGMVGRELLNQLLDHDGYDRVKIFGRRKVNISHEKLKEYIVDFDNPDNWKEELTGDVLFSCMGTTLKKAGSKEVQYRIDYIYQFQTAARASKNGVSSYVLISAQGASSKSGIFYSRMKGELDEAVKKLPFKKVAVMRPSILDGDRLEKRTGEQMALKVMRRLAVWGLVKKYRPIHAKTVAASMINTDLSDDSGYRIVDHLKMFDLAGHGI